MLKQLNDALERVMNQVCVCVYACAHIKPFLLMPAAVTPPLVDVQGAGSVLGEGIARYFRMTIPCIEAAKRKLVIRALENLLLTATLSDEQFLEGREAIRTACVDVRAAWATLLRLGGRQLTSRFPPPPGAAGDYDPYSFLGGGRHGGGGNGAAGTGSLFGAWDAFALCD
jgi:hypothetical protein